MSLVIEDRTCFSGFCPCLYYNAVARQMYRSFGFEETGEMDGEELIAVLRL